MSRSPDGRPARPVLQRGWRRSQSATRAAFGIIVVFVLAQAAWWVMFEFRSIDERSRDTNASWARDVATANAWFTSASGGSEADAVLAEILGRYPHLTFDAASERFEVDAADRRAFLDEQARRKRMLAFEGPTFAVVVLSMLLLIASSLRSERDLKQRQQNFLSAVTHEFKTPISTLRLLVQTARMRTLPAAKQQDYLARMESELDRLERTSDQVLASARLEASLEPPTLEAHDLNRLVQSVVGRMRAGLEARGATVNVTYCAAPLPVSVDPNAFAMVLGNLLDNAVKYSPGPEKSVCLSLAQRGDLIETHVDDEGVGLAPGDEERIFDRFYRAGDELRRESPGVGLGLHLVRSTVEAMNGWVAAGPNPTAERGARFTVVLPRRVEVAA
ncbi:MAG: HAMP domain-containing sensor histidine kinase [Trueperaceae bacterium]